MNNVASNCKNCGAVMEYTKQNYGGVYKCPYCGTEHHIDLLGRVEDYKVKFMFMGRIIEAYLSCFKCEPQIVETSYIDECNGRTYIDRRPSALTFEFIGYPVEEVK